MALDVSIIIPCHNSSAFVYETAAAVLAQTLQAFEVIFVDDGSVDDTPDKIARVIADARDRCVRLICQADSGLASARNHGIAEARGKYILPLDADDLIAPTMLAECAGVLDAEPDTAFVYTDRQDFGEVDRVWPAGRYALDRLKYFNQIGYCALFRRTMWEAIGGYRVNVSGLDDWDFWVAAAARGFHGHHIAKPHLKHRTRRGSLMWRILGDYERMHAQIVLNNHEAYSRTEVELAERFLSTGEPAPFLRAARFVFSRQFLSQATDSRVSS
jgi:glycosyltransferase involved in cell wall biosynthesis